MDERKGVTVSYLRQLARKYLREGAGASRGRELVTSLAERIPALGRLARMAGLATSRRGSGAVGGEERTLDSGPAESQSAKAPTSGSVPLPPPESAAAPQARELSEEPITEPGGGPKTRPARVVTFPARGKARRDPDDEDTLSLSPEAPTPRPSSAPSEDPPAAAPPSPASEPPHAAEPLVEGFFVTKMAGEKEARRHHLLEEHAPRLPPADVSPERDEHLAMLPLDYQDDAMVLLARDPHTLFVFWDFSDASRSRALDGLPVPRAVMKVFDGEGVSREVDFALESRSFYLQGMTPGRTYRVEAHFVGSDGRSRRIGHSSNRATLPPAGPSEDTSIRFLRMPPPPVVDRSREAVPAAATARGPRVEEREYVTWRRVKLPGSAGVADVPEVHRERTEAYVDAPRVPGASDQRYVEEAYLESAPRAPGASDQQYARVGEATLGEGAVLAPSRAPGASDQRYLAVELAPGASDQRYDVASPYLEVPRAPGASEQRYDVASSYLEVPRAPAASDQRYGEALPGGVSEYRYLEVPRAPGASDQRYVAGGQGTQGARHAPGISDQRYLTVPRAAGASDQQYLSVPRAAGASDQQYLTVSRAAGASDQRYLSAERVTGASDQQYLTVPRTAGASDQRYLSAERATGASDQQYLTVPRAAGASDQRYLSVDRATDAPDQQYPTAPRAAGTSDQRHLSLDRASDQPGVSRAAGGSDAWSPETPRSQGDALEARDLSSSRPAAQAPGSVLSAPSTQEMASTDSWRPTEPEPPKDPWALSVARGPSASEQRALDKAREATEAARRAAPASVPAKVEGPAAPSTPPAKTQAVKSPPAEPAKAAPKAPEPQPSGSKSSSKSRPSRRGRK
ncbi:MULTISPECIES: DUF4912 domain-containing protein [unclassified Corallococcus]|uniref:DUF4912 domain-containing protein n=1 Tax=unclassified Corallococcus TaxID=2685029 RepID=UPI001A8CA0EF|nr:MULTISPECIES: DUF4912 domain-containing protein [unclassified Corallococcus]MBN9684287.1 DUF4912 domain-containing protein [Corallococcus sp. NCSPR001]WAS84231.1 DUF4912 domain-containing protein [Corallococcus sp. NCRR]